MNNFLSGLSLRPSCSLYPSGTDRQGQGNAQPARACPGLLSWSLSRANPEVDSELPKVLLKVLFWALLKVLLLGKVLFKVLKNVLEIMQYPKKC